jgi:hypothetical protein
VNSFDFLSLFECGINVSFFQALEKKEKQGKPAENGRKPAAQKPAEEIHTLDQKQKVKHIKRMICLRSMCRNSSKTVIGQLQPFSSAAGKGKDGRHVRQRRPAFASFLARPARAAPREGSPPACMRVVVVHVVLI